MSGIQKIAQERARQLKVENFSTKEDFLRDPNGQEKLIEGAICYLNSPQLDSKECPINWPFPMNMWKPTPEDRERELIKAGAMIAAEIDRIELSNKQQVKQYEGITIPTELKSFEDLINGDKVTVVDYRGTVTFEFLSHDPYLQNGDSKYNYAYMVESFGRVKVERWYVKDLEKQGVKFYVGYNREFFDKIRIELLQEEQNRLIDRG